MSLTTLFNQGDDAMDTEGYINIPPLDFMSNSGALSMRVTSYSIPGVSAETQELRYMNGSIDIPKPGNSNKGEFKISFRCDKYWQVYTELFTWKRLISDGLTGANFDFGTSAFSDLTFTKYLTTNITVYSADTRGVQTSSGWKFYNSYITSLGAVNFDQSSAGSPIVIDATFRYRKFLPVSYLV